MYYCYNFKEDLTEDHGLEKEMLRAKRQGQFLYYDKTKNTFFNEDDQAVDIHGVSIFPISGSLELEEFLETLENAGAIIPTTRKDYKMIREWYKYVEPKRKMVSFRDYQLTDLSFLTYLIELFAPSKEDGFSEEEMMRQEVFFKTRTKDYSGIVSLVDLFTEDSDIRKAISYHPNEEFIVSEKVPIDQDDIRNIEYRAFIQDGHIMNISRITEKNYHKIPEEVIHFIEDVLENQLPDEFPTTFALDIFSYQQELDILEFNPLESAGKYLYNSIFEFSPDLTHELVETIPEEKKSEAIGYQQPEKFSGSTTKQFSGTFSKDYADIQMYGMLLGNQYIHILGEPGVKIDLAKILDSAVAYDLKVEAERFEINLDEPKIKKKE